MWKFRICPVERAFWPATSAFLPTFFCSAPLRASALLLLACAATLAAQSPKYGVGRPPTAEQILNLGASIAADGSGLPEGSGTVAAGREASASRCSHCHGEKGEGGVGPPLVGGQGTLATAKPLKTV